MHFLKILLMSVGLFFLGIALIVVVLSTLFKFHEKNHPYPPVKPHQRSGIDD